jgi:hypothetical protein
MFNTTVIKGDFTREGNSDWRRGYVCNTEENQEVPGDADVGATIHEQLQMTLFADVWQVVFVEIKNPWAYGNVDDCFGYVGGLFGLVEGWLSKDVFVGRARWVCSECKVP